MFKFGLSLVLAVGFSVSAFAQLLGGFTQGTNPNGPPVQWRTVAEGVNSRILKFDQRILTTESDWAKFYAQMVGLETVNPNLVPRLADFSKQHLIVIHMGQQSTAGFRTYVSTISRPRADIKLIEVMLTSPPNGLILAQQLTSPYVVIAVDQTTGNYDFSYKRGITSVVNTGGTCTCQCGCCGGGNSLAGQIAAQSIGGATNRAPEICPPFPAGTGGFRGGGF